MTFNESAYTYMGVTPKAFVDAMRDAGADAVGANCSLGPEEMLHVAEILVDAAGSLPVLVQPNAGQPQMDGTDVFYDMTPEDFADGMCKMMDAGVNLVGGCCGTTPDMIALLREKIDTRDI
jgi:5-methyltetrahydrofolate--homocysteine methyltransferase